MKIVFIGAGNLATRLSLAMQRVGMQIGQVYSHTEASARQLATRLGCPWTNDLSALQEDGDLYVFSLKDTVLSDVISKVKPNNGMWVHTAGSMPMSVFEGYAQRFGVLYPLQTFSKGRNVNFDVIPIFLEANTDKNADYLKNIASALSENVRFMSSEKRRSLHLAAVFACNFTNHIYTLSYKLLENESIPADVLLPLIDETVSKIHSMPPAVAQTGPAIRYDENVINKHLAMLDDPDMQAIYRLLSQSIHKEAQNE
ncbi:DUF2520 domain-containing protein [Parabacteroides sp. AM58-2XD]|jgi:predicted short-subunit dehydrogenase-like oxidoreductase (DUF2520 family)|uniref:DUF2520 domain-containing protein n=1 Tax=Parabacteroides segnis TaxID=2763058 RepID=A0ABR7DYJ5_9BACT|nr:MULTISPECIES: Rossmann-like and DUF2520 domain-containing protein [Parabacteroides]MBC5642600.1 DUF2520 domain-containing protein [Parabacteroides segnis]MCM0711648.1 DUF2520 domain-containing protein [Parabacteroides sp. TA-V-105]RGY98774.1 DUF2520 domain-containing protein [Parabacteroides sp. AM58-2XD]GKG71414.1 hypothetical protein CE91St1_05570 [Parabacteroides goldsteinii]GKG77367.1 hypothetical protein CE91St2_05590 [Parabacteroides goldsteinii]